MEGKPRTFPVHELFTLSGGILLKVLGSFVNKHSYEGVDEQNWSQSE